MIALVCPYCGGKLRVSTRLEGRPYMQSDVPDEIECVDCDSSWSPSGEPIYTPGAP